MIRTQLFIFLDIIVVIDSIDWWIEWSIDLDIDECSNNPCGQNAVCRNTPGSYECICPHNFRGDPYSECSIEGINY